MWVVGIAAVVSLILYATVFDIWVLPSDDPAFAASVLPTLAPGDVVLVTRHGASPDLDYLEKCTDPDAPGRFVVGRVVGLPGDKVGVSSDVYKRNGHAAAFAGPCDPNSEMDVANPKTQAVKTLICHRTDEAALSHGSLRGTDDYENDMAAVTVDPNRVYLLSDDLHFHEDSRDYGQIDPATCEHIVFRLYGAAGITDGSRRFALLW